MAHKTPAESRKIPTVEDNVRGLELTRFGIEAARGRQAPKGVDDEAALLRREVLAIFENLDCGHGDSGRGGRARLRARHRPSRAAGGSRAAVELYRLKQNAPVEALLPWLESLQRHLGRHGGRGALPVIDPLLIAARIAGKPLPRAVHGG